MGHREAGAAQLVEQPVEVLQRGLWSVALGVPAVRLGVAQDREEAPHVAQRRGVGLLDRVQCTAHLPLVAAERPPCAPGLQHGHRDGVGDDVVKFAGDPGPLLGDRETCPLLLVALELTVLGVEHRFPLPAHSDRQPGDPGPADEAHGEGNAAEPDLR